MDAAKADQQGEVLGIGGYCHGFFLFLLLPAATRRANSIATLELMALGDAVAIFYDSFRHFLRVVLESDSLFATFHHLADDKAKDDAAQRAPEYLHAMPAFLNAKLQLHVRNVFVAAKPMADACSRSRFHDLYALCARLGVHSKRLHVPHNVAAFLSPLVPEQGAFNFDMLLLAGTLRSRRDPRGS
eukprot:6203364-Pleurochrysis_carterae.AAC.3